MLKLNQNEIPSDSEDEDMEALDEDVQIVEPGEPVVLAEDTPDENETAMETQSTSQQEGNRSDSDETIDPFAVVDVPSEHFVPETQL